MEPTYDFGPGRRLLLLSDKSAKWVDLNGQHIAYATVEHVTYQPTLAGQYAAQRLENASAQ
jgi:hypothetical protein